MAASASKKVVVTHHVPTLYRYPLKFKDGVFTPAFATNLDEFIKRMTPDIWVFGHHHYNVPEFRIGKTRMLTNQLGYVRLNEHNTFQRNGVFEV